MGGNAQWPRLRHRLFALTALLALTAAIGALGYLLVSRLVVLPFAIAAVIVAALAGWTALISRGLRRVIGLTIGGLALIVAAWLLGPSTLVGVAVVAGLVIASSATARAAIGRHRPGDAPAQLPPDMIRVGRSERPVLLFNPRSGGGAVERTGLVAKANRRRIACVMLRAEDDLRQLAEREIRDGATVIGMAGGDGSQALIADVARRHDIPFVCVPAGTRNHFAQDLGLDRRDPVGALAAFGDACERRVDLATVNERIFVNNASMGVYAAIVQADGYRNAKLATVAAMLPDLVGAEATPFDLKFTGPDGTEHESADLLMVSNNAYALATPVGLASRPRLDTGELGIVCVRRAHEGAPTPARDPVLNWASTTFRVDSAGPVAIGLDGEAVQLDAPLEFATLPRALRVRVPLTAVAPAAAGRAPGVRATALALVRIVGGRPSWPGPTAYLPTRPEAPSDIRQGRARAPGLGRH